MAKLPEEHPAEINLEDLLRLKRSERPSDAFWSDFDRDLEEDEDLHGDLDGFVVDDDEVEHMDDEEAEEADQIELLDRKDRRTRRAKGRRDFRQE